jgi:hypothetical protein
MNQTFDRSKEDLGNSVGLEHLNLTVPEQKTATIFFIMGLGFTRDPYLVTGVDNMWVNIGRSQCHLPIGEPQAVRGVTGLVVPDREALLKRLAAVKERLAGTQFAYTERDDYVDVTGPWGGTFRCHEPDPERFGPVQVNLAYIDFDVPKGAADGIARFYRQVIGAPATVEKGEEGPVARVTVGYGQQLVFSERKGELRPYDGHHLQLYLVNFSGPHRKLQEKSLVTEESNQYQYRFKDIVDPDSGKLLYQLEHEIRSITHPLYARPLANRNPEQTNRDYKPGYDAASWGIA